MPFLSREKSQKGIDRIKKRIKSGNLSKEQIATLKAGRASTGVAAVTTKELRDAVFKEFDVKTTKQLLNETALSFAGKDVWGGAKPNSNEGWRKVHRKFVGLPKDERNAKGFSSVRGVDVTRNFLPWKAFGISNPNKAIKEQVNREYQKLSKKFHPDAHATKSPQLKAQARKAFEEIKIMRDTMIDAIGRTPSPKKKKPYFFFFLLSSSLLGRIGRKYFLPQWA